MCGAGYFCDQLGTTKTGRPQCAAGHYCPSFQSYVTAAGAGTPEYRQMPCPAGTYNANTASTTVADCTACPAGKACEYQGLTSTSSLPDCAAGYFCASGASSRYPSGSGTSTSGPCPVGYYCGTATSTPTACPAGTFSNQLKATSADYCIACPPGELCEGTGNSAPTSTCASGTFCSDGINTTGCAASLAGQYCPLGSHFELLCPMGFYQSNQNRGNCLECTAGSYCMVGAQTVCDAGYYCP